ncbi:uncharacterized protein LOC124948739 isoform X1 [Vespa velutina]|uniref:uncharacterized protein LOC124948739 isoform X1 n=1 Tax=Vespa velutina TaxID=202808 RepID=UPI001FB409C2|nr:uncharacterized protein LOC124948739 isoform X1 [Vespa velutina]
MMSSVPRLNYSVENETAEIATKTFALILQKAYEQYQKLWNKYLDLVKTYGVDNSMHKEIQEAWKEENVLKSIHAFTDDVEFLTKFKYQKNLSDEEEVINDRKRNVSFMKENNDVLEKSLFDRDIDIDDTIYQSPCKKSTNLILPESPIFIRKDEKSINMTSENEVSMNSDNTIIPCTVETDNKSDYSEQNIGDNCMKSEQYLNNISFNNCSPFVVYNTPVVNKQCNKKNRKKLFKKAHQNKQQLNDNLVSPKKEQMKDKESSIYYKFHTTSDDKKLRQTTLPFYNIKKEVDNTTLTSTEKDVTIKKPKRFLFNCKSSIENIMQSKAISDRKIDIINLNDINDKNETIFDDVIESSPDYKHVQLENRSRIKLKRRLKKTDHIKVTALSCNNSIEMQNKVCSTKNPNFFIDDDGFLSPEMDADNIKKKCLTFRQDIQSEQKLAEKNNYEGIACTKQIALSPLQYTCYDETYFEESSLKENNINNVNKEINKNLLRLENMKKNDHEYIYTDKSTKKDDKVKNQKWSCWECAEYYKNKPGISEKQVQMWKNQCSRHKNVYYAREATPPGFWDPLFPDTVSDNTQQK